MVQFVRNLGRSHLVIEIVGWLGVGLIIVAYALLSFSILESRNGVYQIMNLLGSVGIIINSFAKKDYQPAALNIVWALIAIFALINLAS